MPVGALRSVSVEMALIDIRIGRLLVEPIANAVAALAKEQFSCLNMFDDPTRFFLAVPLLWVSFICSTGDKLRSI